jgi:hypothetical protein
MWRWMVLDTREDGQYGQSDIKRTNLERRVKDMDNIVINGVEHIREVKNDIH